MLGAKDGVIVLGMIDGSKMGVLLVVSFYDQTYLPPFALMLGTDSS